MPRKAAVKFAVKHSGALTGNGDLALFYSGLHKSGLKFYEVAAEGDGDDDGSGGGLLPVGASQWFVISAVEVFSV